MARHCVYAIALLSCILLLGQCSSQTAEVDSKPAETQPGPSLSDRLQQKLQELKATLADTEGLKQRANQYVEHARKWAQDMKEKITDKDAMNERVQYAKEKGQIAKEKAQIALDYMKKGMADMKAKLDKAMADIDTDAIKQRAQNIMATAHKHFQGLRTKVGETAGSLHKNINKERAMQIYQRMQQEFNTLKAKLGDTARQKERALQLYADAKDFALAFYTNVLSKYHHTVNHSWEQFSIRAAKLAEQMQEGLHTGKERAIIAHGQFLDMTNTTVRESKVLADIFPQDNHVQLLVYYAYFAAAVVATPMVMMVFGCLYS